LDLAQKTGADLVALGEPGYPPALAAIQAPPPLLYIKGNPQVLEQPIVAIVGARNGSAIGQKLTSLIATGLGRYGFIIASGLARGIDRAAHLAAMERGTVAVVAGGVNVVYPPEHLELQNEIAATGCLVSERPPNLRPRGQDFPRRNRIIAGMALGTLVVEAATRSGSLITARFAGELGREVFAIPGHPLDPRAAGTNRLLKQGATLVTDADDIAEQLGPLLGSRDDLFNNHERKYERMAEPCEELAPVLDVPVPADDDRARTIEALGPTPIEIDELSRLIDIEIRALQVILLELDLAGRLTRHPGQLVSLRYPD
jgi:DNA processing protein